MNCQRCGSEIEEIEQIRLKPAWQGGGRETVKRALPCETCAKRSEEETSRIMQDRKIRNWRLDSGIPENVWDMSLDRDVWAKRKLRIDQCNEEAFDVLKVWVETANAGALIWGKQGRGKSTLAISAGLDCLRRSQEVLFISEVDLIDSYRNRSEANQGLVRRAMDVEVLILDNVGRHEITRGTAYLKELYFDLLDRRLPILGDPLKTLVTSQHDAPSLSEWCSDGAMASRLLSIIQGNELEITGDDRRHGLWLRQHPKGGA